MNCWQLIQSEQIKKKSLFQEIVNKVFSFAVIKEIIQLGQGRINYIYRVVLEQSLVKSVIIRIRYMNDEKFLQGFYCEKWVNEFLPYESCIMPEIYYADENSDFGFAYMVCEDIVGVMFTENTDSSYIYQAGEILAGIHLAETDFIGKYLHRRNIDAGSYYNDFFKSVLMQLKDINYFLYRSVSDIVDKYYYREHYANKSTVVLHHDYHMQNLMIRESDKKIFVIDWDSARSGVPEVDYIKAKYLFTEKISDEKKFCFFRGYSDVKKIDITSNYPIQELIWLCKMYMFETERSLEKSQTFYPSAKFYYNKLLKAISDYYEYSEKCYDYFCI